MDTDRRLPEICTAIHARFTKGQRWEQKGVLYTDPDILRTTYVYVTVVYRLSALA